MDQSAHFPATAPRPQRARGSAIVGVALRGGVTRLARLRQQGCAKAFLPRNPGGPLEAVFVNTSGGIAGGDRLDWGVDVGPGATLVATTQAAERVYRSTGATARAAARLAVGADGRLDWLPQETILFEGARLRRRLDAELAADARLTALETVVLGRAAMGETLRAVFFCDHWRIRRDGRLVRAEALRLDEAALAAGGDPAMLAGGRALATLLCVEPGVEARLDAIRAMLAPSPPVTAATSARDGVLAVRFLAPGHAPLKTALTRFLTAFRGGPPPRVWSI